MGATSSKLIRWISPGKFEDGKERLEDVPGGQPFLQDVYYAPKVRIAIYFLEIANNVDFANVP
jgi:hypothetical protein